MCFAVDLSDDGSAQPLSRDYTQSSYHAADREVDHHRFLSVARSSPESRKSRSNDHDAGISQEARRYHKLLHLLNVGDGTLFWRIKNDDDGAKDGQETRHLADEAQFLFQEDRAQDRCDYHGESAQRRDHDRIDEHVRRKVAAFSDDHQDHSRPPPSVLEVSVPFASLLIVFDIRLEQSYLFDNEAYADEQA